MADTTNTPINKADNWVEMAATGAGFFSASKPCQYCLAAAIPADDFQGHRLSNSETKRYSLTAPDKIYTKGPDGTIIILTEDV